MSNTSSTPTTAIRGSSSGTNAAAAAGVTMSMRGPCPTTTTTTTSYHEQQCPTTAAVIYPVASSGRGFLPTNHPCRPILPYHHHPHSLPFGNPRPPPPPLPHPTHFHPPLKGLPLSLHPKVASSPSSLSETKGYKSVRDRTKDDSLVNVRDRKVRITDGTSVYALSRSWLRNGFPDETQGRGFPVEYGLPQYGDVIKSLPQPLSVPVTDNLAKDMEDEAGQEVEDKKEDEQSVKNLSALDLLKRHINRAKKVRLRLRQERLKRIARYKTRLALLLPPLVEQFRSDAAAGN